MKIIFLDIDGVLNHWEHDHSENPIVDFTPRCVRAFNRIIAETDAKIVISSTWRLFFHRQHFSKLGFSKLLRSHGVRGELIGFTRSERATYESRWIQIADWLKDNPDHDGHRKICILDDDPAAFGGRPGIVIDGAVGLTEPDADQAILLLSDDTEIVPVKEAA